MSEPKLKETEVATANDSTFQQLQKFILDFSNGKNSMPPELIPYFQFRRQLSVAEGVISKSDKIKVVYK